MENKANKEIENGKVILVLRGYTGEKLLNIVDACYAGGIRVIETPFSSDGSVQDEEICGRIRLIKEKYGDRLCVGAGTVLTESQVEKACNAGAGFIVSPVTDEKVIAATKARGLVSIAGAMTPTEIYTAHKAGADFVKIFPAEQIGGPAFIKALKAPFPQIKFIAFGGVTIADTRDYISAGAVGIGIASEILNHSMIEEGNFKGIENLARKCCEAADNRFLNQSDIFNKITIPMSHLFTNGFPVSRPEARRLVMLIKDFKEVTLDFSGIEDVGQAFVHEFFVVQKDCLANTAIEMINQSDDVRFMINRQKRN